MAAKSKAPAAAKERKEEKKPPTLVDLLRANRKGQEVKKK